MHAASAHSSSEAERAPAQVLSDPSDAARPARADALIMAMAEHRDREAFAALFQHFAPRVKAYLMRMGAAPPQAEELAQEVLVTVWRKAALFDPARASAATWIFRIARNLRLDGLRRDRHAAAYEPDPADAPEPQATPEGLSAARQRDERVRAAVASLSPDQLRVVQLSFFQDCPHAEIAETLGLPLGTVKSRIRIALQRLRAVLETEP